MREVQLKTNHDMWTVLLFTDPFQDHTPQYRSQIVGGECGGWWDLGSIDRNLQQYTAP